MQGVIVEFQFADDFDGSKIGVRPTVTFVKVAELVDNSREDA